MPSVADCSTWMPKFAVDAMTVVPESISKYPTVFPVTLAASVSSIVTVATPLEKVASLR